MSPVSFEVAAGIAGFSALAGLLIAWHLFRQFRELARLKAEPDLSDLYAAIQILIAPLSELHGTDWLFTRYLLREADVVFWEVSHRPPEQISHITEHLQRLKNVTTPTQIEQVLQRIRSTPI